MPERETYEADLFRRYEARIVTLELLHAETRAAVEAMKPVVDNLETDRLLHDAIAANLTHRDAVRLSRLQLALVVVALFVPPTISALLIHVLASR